MNVLEVKTASLNSVTNQRKAQFLEVARAKKGIAFLNVKQVSDFDKCQMLADHEEGAEIAAAIGAISKAEQRDLNLIE